MAKRTWTELKSLLEKKKGALQYEDQIEQYKVWFVDGVDVYESRIEITDPAGTDQEDFEDNYKDDANQPLAPRATDTTPYVRVTEKTVGKYMQLLGFEFTAVADDTTDYLVKWDHDVEFVGAVSKTEGAHKGDTANMSIVDVDNILGYGAGFVVTEFGKDVPGKMLEIKCEANTTTAATVLTGLYIRIRYVNTHATEDVEVYGTLRYYH